MLLLRTGQQELFHWAMHSRGLLLEFLATSGDFTRRLTGIEANSKFSTPYAGPEEYFSVSAWPQNVQWTHIWSCFAQE